REGGRRQGKASGRLGDHCATGGRGMRGAGGELVPAGTVRPVRPARRDVSRDTVANAGHRRVDARVGVGGGHWRLRERPPNDNEQEGQRSACTTGSLAARRAGKKPPAIPITTAKMKPASNKPGVTRKLNAISLKLDQLVVLATTPFTGSASRQPTTPPSAAMIADSARKLARTDLGGTTTV